MTYSLFFCIRIAVFFNCFFIMFIAYTIIIYIRNLFRQEIRYCFTNRFIFTLYLFFSFFLYIVLLVEIDFLQFILNFALTTASGRRKKKEEKTKRYKGSITTRKARDKGFIKTISFEKKKKKKKRKENPLRRKKKT